jgi:aspartokinase
LEDINISLISHGASAVNLTFVVKEVQLVDVVKRLHGAFFDKTTGTQA